MSIEVLVKYRQLLFKYCFKYVSIGQLSVRIGVCWGEIKFVVGNFFSFWREISKFLAGRGDYPLAPSREDPESTHIYLTLLT